MRKTILDIRLVIFEAAITAGLVSFPIISLFYASLGLTQEQMALTQVACTATLMVLNVPCGWLADRFGRKQANVLGDAICALALLCYSMTQGFWGIVACECLFGVGAALSQGVDSSLLKHFCEKDQRSFRDDYARMTTLCMIASLLATLICGPVSKLGYRATIAISAIPYALGALAAAFIHDDSERITAAGLNGAAKITEGAEVASMTGTAKAAKMAEVAEVVEMAEITEMAGRQNALNALREIAEIVRRNLQNRRLRVRIAAYAVAREITHGVIWFFSPLLESFGWPVTVISVAVAINELCKVLGATLAKRYAKRLKDWQIFLIPIVVVAGGCTILTVFLSPLMIGFFACFGLACGWVSATMMPIVKEEIAASEQSTVESAARVISGLLYMVSVWLINKAAGVSYRLGFATVLIIFLPLALLVLPKMLKDKK